MTREYAARLLLNRVSFITRKVKQMREEIEIGELEAEASRIAVQLLTADQPKP